MKLMATLSALINSGGGKTKSFFFQIFRFIAEGRGFEPLKGFLPNRISNAAQ